LAPLGGDQQRGISVHGHLRLPLRVGPHRARSATRSSAEGPEPGRPQVCTLASDVRPCWNRVIPRICFSKLLEYFWMNAIPRLTNVQVLVMGVAEDCCPKVRNPPPEFTCFTYCILQLHSSPSPIPQVTAKIHIDQVRNYFKKTCTKLSCFLFSVHRLHCPTCRTADSPRNSLG